MDVNTFIDKWLTVSQTERAVSQSHFLDLCNVLGEPAPTDADPAGHDYCFEFGAAKASGGDGWADVFKRGCFGWEYKGKKRDLKAAYEQLLDYRVSLFNPPLLITCDLNRFVIHTNFQNSPYQAYEFTLEELNTLSSVQLQYTNLELLRFAFSEPERLRIGDSPLRATEQAAENIGDLALKLRKRDIPPMAAAHFVMRLVFCMFAEDIGLLAQPFLTKALDYKVNDPNNGATHKFIAELFSQMDKGGWIYTDEIPPFNGGLFDGSPPIMLEWQEAKQLRRAAHLDWSRIEPSIFGTLLERAIDPARQQQLGAHYTHPDDVQKVIDPVVLEPLRQEWVDLRAHIETLLQGEKQGNAHRDRIEGFLKRLRDVRILDPACGSGNFLYLSLRAVMDLEAEVFRYAHRHNIPVLAEERVGPEILLGREIDEYAKELASTVIWIGYIQHRLAYSGRYDDRPILRPLDNIVLADSILNPDGSRPEWPECDYIVGNPPFFGSKKMRKGTPAKYKEGVLVEAAKPGLGDSYVNGLHAAYKGEVGAESDLCCYFFEQARQHMMQGRANRSGLLATNSIRGVYSRGVLEVINRDTPIFEAWSDREWILDGAQVRTSIVCFGRSEDAPSGRILDGEPVPAIHADLTSGLDLTVARKLPENARIAFMGDKKNGAFNLSEDTATRMLSARGNPNRRPNSDVVVRWITGRSLLTPSITKWIIDFGTSMSEEEAAQYVMPFEYVRVNVKPVREAKSDYPDLQERWWIHGSPAHRMRAAFAQMSRALATVRHTNTRVFLFINPTHLLDSALIGLAIDDWYRLGALECRLHKLWTVERGRSDLRGWTRYTPSTVFATFPFPRLSPHLRERYPLADHPLHDRLTGELHTLTEAEADSLVATVEEAARELSEARDEVVFNDPECSSYTTLYQANPPWLQHAHAKLDRAVLACYGLPPDATRHDILALLLEENLSRAAGG